MAVRRPRRPDQRPTGGAIMRNEQYLETQMQVVRMAALARTLPLAEFLSAIDRAETMGPILDPTLYRAAMPKLDQVKALAASLRRFQVEAEKLAAVLEGEVAHA